MKRKTRWLFTLWMLGVSPLMAGGPAANLIQATLDVDRQAVGAEKTQTAIVQLTLASQPAEANPRPQPINLALAFDRSRSMSGEKLENAKRAAIALIKELRPEDTFALVSYARNVRADIPAQKAKQQLNTVIEKIETIDAEGDSAIFAGISRAAAELRKQPLDQHVNRILLISDGVANVGPNDANELGRLANALRKEGIVISTVGLGTHYSEDVMARLAEQSNGNTYFVESSRDLSRVLSSERKDMSAVVAKEVNVTINLPENVKPIRTLNGGAQIRGNQVEASFNQFRGGSTKNILIETELSPMQKGTTVVVARASVSANDPQTGKERLSEVEASVGVMEVPAESQMFLYNDVNINNAIFVNANIQREAVGLIDQGENREAASKLRASASKLRSVAKNAPPGVQGRMVKKAEENEMQADSLEQTEQVPARMRKKLITESTQELYQQSVR